MSKLLLGRRYIMTKKNKQRQIAYTVRINSIEEKEHGSYFGYTPEDIRHGVFGYATYYNEVPEYGVIHMELMSILPHELSSLAHNSISNIFRKNGDIYISYDQVQRYIWKNKINIHDLGVIEMDIIVNKIREEELDIRKDN